MLNSVTLYRAVASTAVKCQIVFAPAFHAVREGSEGLGLIFEDVDGKGIPVFLRNRYGYLSPAVRCFF